MYFFDLCVGTTQNNRGDAWGTLRVCGKPTVSWPWLERDLLNPIKIQARFGSDTVLIYEVTMTGWRAGAAESVIQSPSTDRLSMHHIPVQKSLDV